MGRPGDSRSSEPIATIRRIWRHTNFEPLSTVDVSCVVTILDTVNAEVVLSKPGWKESAKAMLPLRHLRAGTQVHGCPRRCFSRRR